MRARWNLNLESTLWKGYTEDIDQTVGKIQRASSDSTAAMYHLLNVKVAWKLISETYIHAIWSFCCFTSEAESHNLLIFRPTSRLFAHDFPTCRERLVWMNVSHRSLKEPRLVFTSNRKRGLLTFSMPKFHNTPYSLTVARKTAENWPQKKVRRKVLQREWW